MQNSFLINPSAGNISGQKNFKQPAIPLMAFFDESFWAECHRRRAGTGLRNIANFTPVSPPVSSESSLCFVYIPLRPEPPRFSQLSQLSGHLHE
jgi:hypothetical protein